MASSQELQEEDDCAVLAHSLGVPKDSLTQIVGASEDGSVLVKKVRESLQQHNEKEATWRTEMTALRRARVNAEQQFSQIEKQLTSCNSKLDKEVKRTANLTTELQQSEVLLADTKKKLQQSEEVKDDALANYSKVAKVHEQLETEKLELLAVLDRKSSEIQTLNEEWKNMSEKLANANVAKLKAEGRLDEIQSQETSFAFRERRLKQEAELVKQQNDWLNEELKKKTEELSELRKTKSSQILELQGSLDERNEELTHLKQSSEESKKHQAELQKNIESYMEKLKEVRCQLVKSEENYKLELSSQSKLAQLYKDEAEVNSNKAKEMLTAMDELQKLLKTSEEARLELASKLQESEEHNTKNATELESKVSQLEQELKTANDLLKAARQRGHAPMTPEALAEMSPTAAATSSLLKSGMTLTEIYSQYVQVSDELQQEKDENVRLKNYMEQILKELEEKAPILQQQRKDYEQALHSNDKLTKKLETAIVEHEHAVIAAEEARKQCDHMKRENARLKTLSDDLSHQVQVLLRECEETRAGRTKMAETFSDEVTSSSQVISERLVSFKSIEELQQQNQKLLVVIRELSEDKEKQESQGSDLMLTNLKEQLNVALKEVEQVKLDRSRQMEMVDLMVRQRDMYRTLLANTGQSPIPLSVQDSSMLNQSPSIPDKSLMAVEQTRDTLRELQNHFADYKDERKLAEDKLNERLEMLRMDNVKLAGENSKFKSQVEFSDERYKMLQSNFESAKKEATTASDKAHHLNLANVKLQAIMDSQSQELASIKEKLNKAQISYENLTAEKAMLRDSEVRLLQENKSLLEQQKASNVLVTNLQKLQNQLERNEFDTRTKLEAHVESLQKELTLTKRKLDSDETHRKNIIRKLENQVQELRTQMDTNMKNHVITKESLANSTKQLEILQNKYAEAKAQGEAAEKRLNEILTKEQVISGGDVDKEKQEIIVNYEVMLQEANQNLKEANTRVKGLEEQLKQSKLQEEQYKSMSLAQDEALKNLNVATDEIQSNLQTSLTQTEDNNSYLQGQIQGLESKINSLILEKNSLEKESARQVTEVQDILSTIRSELEEARIKARSASAAEQLAKEELNEQVQIASQFQEKYERELALHLDDIKTLAEATEKLQDLEGKFSEVADRGSAAEEKLNSCTEVWEQHKKQHELEMEKLQSRCADLVNQNSTLHKELDKVVAQIGSAENPPPSYPPSSSEGASEEHGKSLVELWEIVRFVRREKEISDTKAEMAQTESMRYQQRCKLMEKKVEDFQKNIKQEKSLEEVDVDIAAKHAEVLEKVEKLNVLTEANKVLTDEKQSLEQKNKALEGKVKKLEGENQSAKESNRSLTVAKDSLLGEKSALKNEIMRWTTKTNNLMEQYKNINIDEYKRMTEEKKLFQQQIASLKTESQRAKVQLESVKTNATSTSEELTALQKKHASLSADNQSLKNEIETLKKAVTEKTDEIKEKITTLNKVKRIARQYKSQHDDLKKKQQEEPQAPTATAAAENKPEGEGVDVSSYENQIKDLTAQVQNLEEQVKTLKDVEEQNKVQSKEKEDKSKKVLIQAREKIQQLTAAKDRLGAEKEELKKLVSSTSDSLEKASQEKKELETRLHALQSQYDGRIGKVEKELHDCRASKDAEIQEALNKLEEKNLELEQLQQLTQQQQKQIQQLQQAKLTSIATVTSAVSDGSQSADSSSGTATASVSLAPPTATIKPTSTAIKNTSTKTASIRPMTQATSTPTATVLPTVPSSTLETATTFTAVIQPRGQATVVSTSSMSATVRPITSGQSSDVSGEVPGETPRSAVDSQPAVETPQRIVVDAQPTRTTPDTIQPSSSSNKRLREEETERPSHSQDSEPLEKKLRTTVVSDTANEEEDDGEEKHEVPVIEHEITGRDTPEIVLIESGDEEEDQVASGKEDTDEDMEEGVGEDEEEESDYEEENIEDKRAIDVVEVIDDDDEEEDDYEGNVEGGDDVDVDDADDDAYEEEEYEEEKDMGEDIPESEPADQIEEGEEEEEEEEEVVDATVEEEGDKEEEEASIPEDEQQEDPDVITDDVDVSQASNDVDIQVTQTQAVSHEQTTSSHFVQQQQQQQQQQDEPGPVARSSSIDRPPRSHLPPFSFPPGQSSQVPFDDADDCTVPSTPTLFVPKRTDGFAEAISSPHIHRPFNFAPPTEGTSGMQVLGLESSISEGGMRVDDTHVNLMDETSEESRSSFGDRTSGIQDRNKQTSQSVPETTQSSDTASRQQSLESLESEEDFSSTIITDVPSITVTPVDESSEQNVPDTQEDAGGDVSVPSEDMMSGDKESSEPGDQSQPSTSSSSSAGTGPTRIKRIIKRFPTGRGNARGRGRGANGRGGGASSSTQ